jgi:transcriptional regulator with XRE-family HTH domain
MMADMATDPRLGTRIKRARERKRWTQQQLADAIHVDRKTVDNWENGRTSPRSSIGALEDVLGVMLTAGEDPGESAADVAHRLERLLREREEAEADDEQQRERGHG